MDDPADEWARQCGIEVVRVHIVERPVSDYLWWEFQSYVLSEQAGQRILIADLDDVRDIDEKYQLSDFVLFDETVVWVHDYRDGLLHGAWKTTDPGFLRICSSVAEEFIPRSVPFQEFCDGERPGWRHIEE